MRDVDHWLEGLGLGRYADLFAEHEIDLEVLPDLSEHDLEKLGVPLGHRKKLARAITILVERGRRPELSDKAPSRPAEAERRHLTIMFVDLVGSTALSRTLDPEQMRELILAYQNAVAGEISRFGGHVAKFMGDGVLAYFGWPVASEHDAESAIKTGLSIVQLVEQLRTPHDEPVASRVGISTGTVVVGDLIGEGAAQEEAVVGETPNLAARLEGVAEPGQVVVSQETRALLGDLFLLRELGGQTLKGFSTSVEAYAVLGERPLETRFDALHLGGVLPLVGRQQELELLSERWRQAAAGEGQMVILSGEAGIGKSRISQALIDTVADEPHYRINYQCSPYHSDTELYPTIQQLGFAAGFEPSESVEIKLEKLGSLLARAGVETMSATPLISALLGLDKEPNEATETLTSAQRRARTLQALVDQLMGLARQRSVLFVLEDAHWIDPTTLELIELCLDHIAQAPVLILVTTRPPFDHGFGGHPTVTRLALNRLGRDQVAAMIERLAGEGVLTSALKDEIAAKTDGVPLFVEELTKTVLQSALMREGRDAIPADERLSIPTSLHDSLMARLDRLQPVKEVAQFAACIGREFEFGSLASVSPLSQKELQDALDRLTADELIFRRGIPPDISYTFKHALVRDAAYESILKGKRRGIHIAITEALEAQESSVSFELLAHHAAEAGLAKKAIDYWQRAGQRAAERSANLEAIAHFRKGLAALDFLDDIHERNHRELDLQLSLGAALIAARGFSGTETLKAYERAFELCDGISNGEAPFLALFGRSAYHQVRAEHQIGRGLAEDFLRLAKAEADDRLTLIGHRIVGIAKLHAGEFLAAQDHWEKTLVLYEPERDGSQAHPYGHDSRVATFAYLSWIRWLLGFPKRAWKESEQARIWATELNHPYSQGLSLTWGTAMPATFYRNFAVAEKHGREAIDLATEHRIPMWLGFGNVLVGWAVAMQSRDTRGITQIKTGLANLESIGARMIRPYLLSLLAQALAETEDIKSGLDVVQESLALVERTGEEWWAAELHRMRGELSLRAKTTNVEGSTADFERAIEIARRQSAKSLELRATTSLAGALMQRGQLRESRELLAPICDWFSEGFETFDVKQARS